MSEKPGILVVDDNEDSRLAVIAALRKKEYLFFEAVDGEEGVEMARKHLPAVIIMDLNMPKLNGYEALELIKKDPRTNHIPVVIVTAIGSMDEKIVALEKGADGLWCKPFDRKTLLEQIEALMKLRKLKNENEIAVDNAILHRQSQELIYYYYTDSLTSLPNRSQLIKDIGQKTECGLILIDIDSFKDIVYFYGHQIGDEFLKAFVLRLRSILQGNKYKFYRISSDIFAVVVKNVLGVEEVSEVMEVIKKNFTHIPYLMTQEHEISVRITMGGSVFEKELLISAEKALKTAKKTGRETLLYDEESELFRSYENNIVWVNKINEALADNRITPFFQPIVNNKTGKIEKYESLVRLIEKDGGIVSPFHFLEISKKSRQYGAITKIVVQKAFETFRDTPYSFSINLSVMDMLDRDISGYIFEQLRAFPEPQRVIFELLESEGVENYSEVFGFIAKVKEFGCSVAIDDFGSGYSNFIHLVQLDVDIIKIDGSLIRNLDTNHNALLVVETIVSFAKKLNIPTVAEFVHSEAIYEIVKDLDVDYSQGYFLGQPTHAIL